MTVTDRMVRDAQVVMKDNRSELRYKCIFDGQNMYVYRHVNIGCGYHGNTYKERGWALSWYEINEVVTTDAPPHFVSEVGQ
jgi:hypothetical protein